MGQQSSVRLFSIFSLALQLLTRSDISLVLYFNPFDPDPEVSVVSRC